MKTTFSLFLMLLFLCHCKKEEVIDCSPHCVSGFVCDSETETCVCPQGNYVYNNGCLPIRDYMYVPVGETANCSCFKYITTMWIDSTETSMLLRFRDSTRYKHYPFNYFSLVPNTDTLPEWQYKQEFVVGAYGSLPCKLNEQLFDAHVYVNFSEDSIQMKADMIPYHNGDILHFGEYPVLETYSLLFLRHK